MEIVYCGKSIRRLESEAVERLKRMCNIKQVTYIEDLEHNRITLLPVLEGKTIIIKTLANDEELLHLAEQLKQKLETSGANIIIDQQGKVKRGVLKLLDDQIVFCLDKSLQQEEKVLFYTSLFHANHCNKIVKKLINHLVKIAFTKVSINLAGFLPVLVKIRYWPYLLFTPLPTILIEFSNTEVVRSLGQDLLEWLLDSFTSCYGRAYTADDNSLINQLLEELDNFNSQEQQKLEQETQTHLKQIEEINERIKELLETFKFQEEILAKKGELLETFKLQEEILAKNEELLQSFKLQEEVLAKKEEERETPPPLKTKEKISKAANNQVRKLSSIQPKRNSALLISNHLLNSNKYPLITPLNEPIYQFSRTYSGDAAVPVFAKVIPAAVNTDSGLPGLVSKSLFHRQTKQNIKEKPTDDSSHTLEDIKNNPTEDIKQAKEQVEENSLKNEEKDLSTIKAEVPDFTSALQDFKRPALATEEENLA